jgi:hypothetical protein
MDNISLVTNALEYYDKNIEIYNNLFKDVVYTKNIPPESINGHDIIMFYDKNKKEIFRSRYEILGLHTITSNIWTWGWAVPNLKKNQTNISRKIWMYGSVLDPEISFLKSELITSRFQINFAAAGPAGRSQAVAQSGRHRFHRHHRPTAQTATAQVSAELRVLNFEF